MLTHWKAGMWVEVDGRVGLLFQVGEESCVVHFVDASGNTYDSTAVPKQAINRAPFDKIPASRREGWSPQWGSTQPAAGTSITPAA